MKTIAIIAALVAILGTASAFQLDISASNGEDSFTTGGHLRDTAIDGLSMNFNIDMSGATVNTHTHTVHDANSRNFTITADLDRIDGHRITSVTTQMDGREAHTVKSYDGVVTYAN